MVEYRIPLLMVLLVAGVCLVSMSFSISLDTGVVTSPKIIIPFISGILSLDFFVIVLISLMEDSD